MEELYRLGYGNTAFSICPIFFHSAETAAVAAMLIAQIQAKFIFNSGYAPSQKSELVPAGALLHAAGLRPFCGHGHLRLRGFADPATRCRRHGQLYPPQR